MLYLGAISLGALHAFEPGHGKTLIAAYMVGTRGRVIDGILLGLIVTFTHTFSVIILGIVAKILSKTYSDEMLHGWLGLFSASLILTVGIWMLRQRIKASAGHGHIHLFGKGDHHHDHIPSHSHDHDTTDSHDHSHNHDHNHNHDHVHDHSDHQHDHSNTNHNGHDHSKLSHSHSVGAVAKTKPEKNSLWNLMFLGISGGLIPCPAAIATLLAAIAAGRITKGLTLVIVFSIGLGMVMMSVGVVLAYTGKFTTKISSRPEFGRRLGIVSAMIITILGSATLFHSVKTLWF